MPYTHMAFLAHTSTINKIYIYTQQTGFPNGNAKCHLWHCIVQNRLHRRIHTMTSIEANETVHKTSETIHQKAIEMKTKEIEKNESGPKETTKTNISTEHKEKTKPMRKRKIWRENKYRYVFSVLLFFVFFLFRPALSLYLRYILLLFCDSFSFVICLFLLYFGVFSSFSLLFVCSVALVVEFSSYVYKAPAWKFSVDVCASPYKTVYGWSASNVWSDDQENGISF